MLEAKKITVELGNRSYPILVCPNSLAILAEQNAIQNLGDVYVITDENVAGHYLQQTLDQFSRVCDHVDSIVIPAGEPSKSISQLEKIWNELLRKNANRSSSVVALGGGVVGDLAGFAAATFGRGIDFIQIPTSLLAQVDSSVGGKTGINLPSSKNMVGAFWQPKFVLIDPDVLQTLDEANYRSGLAEVVKYGVSLDAEFFEYLELNTAAIERREPAVLTEIIAKCCELKAQVVKEDELETSGRRAILNYGHTFGHAVENVFGYGKYLHGEAISIGMHCAAKIARELSMVDDDFVTRQYNLLQQLELPTRVSDPDTNLLVEAMHRDKKVSRGTLRLILPTKIGHVQMVDSPGDFQLAATFSE